jgi:ligand-binding sensor domain-containing protein/serine phosphatase RsbU (regulator of sigma subunit)
MPLYLKKFSKTSKKSKGILIMFFLLYAVCASSQSYSFRNFTPEDGLSQSFIYSIIQDSHGYLWIGTGNGLFRYNGFQFDIYTTNDSLADNFITCSINDDENLWFGHSNGGLSLYDGSIFRKVKIRKQDIGRLTHFAKSPSGRIWVSTYASSLLELSKDSGVVKYEGFTDQIIINTFDFISESEVLIGSNTGLLNCRLNASGEIEVLGNVKEIPETRITGLVRMNYKSGFYVATENDGIYRLTRDNNKFIASRITVNENAEFTAVQDIFVDKLSSLWLCTYGSGLIKLENNGSGEFSSVTYFNKASGFVTNDVKTFIQDREGSIWSGNYGKGLTQITQKTFSVFRFGNSSYGNSIFSFCFDQKFRWIGTENGLVKMDGPTDEIISFYSTGKGIPKDTVTSLYSADGAELWIGTGRNGLFRLDIKKGTFQRYNLGEGTLENSVTALAGKNGQVWVGTKKGLCTIITASNEKIWYSINKGGLPHNLINCVYIDKADRVWVSTRSNILSYIEAGKINRVPINSAAGVTTIGPVTEDSESRIWAGSNGNGIFLIQADSVFNITTREGLLSNYCYSMVCDEDNNLWVGHKTGLTRIKTTGFSVKQVQNFEGATENWQFNTNALLKDQGGVIWFGSNKGIVKYDPEMENPLQPPPVLGITSIRINDEDINYKNGIVLPPGHYKIRIEFLGVSLKDPSMVTYQYKLDGYEQWSDITKNTSITYNNLTEGKYSFVVNSSSAEGIVTASPLTVGIIIKKPVWKEFWFFPVNGFILVILTLFYIKRRELRFLTENRKLEEKVIERTQEIQNQKNEIELQRDLIDEKNASITSSIKYASQIQNSVLPPLSLIDSLFPENFILNRPKDIVSGDFYWATQKDGRIVFTVADCSGHGVPGAFMSLLGITLLNEIVNLEGLLQSDAIVTRLRERVIQTLQQNSLNVSNSDGMDLALCVLDRGEKKIQYTGGMNDLVYIRDGELRLLRADRTSACVLYNNTGTFTLNEIDYKNGDVFYLFTDGYRDQFGGENDKKFLTRNFHKALLEIHKLPMPEQKVILEKTLIDWMKDTEQTDDITVMGIRL